MSNPVTTQFTRQNDADFGITADVDNIGGLRVVADIVARDNIPSSHLVLGMPVLVQIPALTIYRLSQISPTVEWTEGLPIVQQFATFSDFPDPNTMPSQLAWDQAGLVLYVSSLGIWQPAGNSTGSVPSSRQINTTAGQLTGGGTLASNLTLGLATTAVTAGTYSFATVTFDALGRATGASNGDTSAFVPNSRTLTASTGLTGGGDLSANRSFALANTAVTPGSYTYANITVDAQGRLTSASSGDVSGFVPTSRTLTASTGITGGGDLTADRSFALANTAVTPGAYTFMNATVDAQGRITSASSGAAVPTSRAINTTAGQLTGGGALTGDLTLGLADTAVTPGAYTFASVTVDQKGRITLASSGDVSGFVPTSRTLTAGAGMSGGGDLTANRTFDVVANADGSIIVNANDIQVGILATDAQHGNRGGGGIHALANGSTAGFMSATEYNALAALVGINGAYNSAASASDNIVELTSANGPVLFRDNATPLAGDLTATQDNAGAITYLGVRALGPRVSGAFDNASDTGVVDSDTQVHLLLENTTAATSLEKSQGSPAIVLRGRDWSFLGADEVNTVSIWNAPSQFENGGSYLNFGNTHSNNTFPNITMYMNASGDFSNFYSVTSGDLGNASHYWSQNFTKQQVSPSTSIGWTSGMVTAQSVNGTTSVVVMTGNSANWTVNGGSIGNTITVLFQQDGTGGWHVGPPTAFTATVLINGTFPLTAGPNGYDSITLQCVATSPTLWMEIGRREENPSFDGSVFALLAGRPGGQNLNGGMAAGENLTLTANATSTDGNVIVSTGATNPLATFGRNIDGNNSDGILFHTLGLTDPAQGVSIQVDDATVAQGTVNFTMYGSTGAANQVGGSTIYVGGASHNAKGGTIQLLGGGVIDGTGDGGDALVDAGEGHGGGVQGVVKLGTASGFTKELHLGAASIPVLLFGDTESTKDILPATDETGNIGKTGQKWNLVRALTVTTGHSLVFSDDIRPSVDGNVAFKNASGGTTVFNLNTTTNAATFTGAVSASNITGSSSGTNTGDATLSGENYLTLAGQAFTANAVDLSGTNATGILAAARFPALTGNVTTTAGSLATTIAPSAVTNAMLAGSIAATKLIGTDIATVGTVTTGTWNATTIAVNHGGTGQTAYTNGQLLIGNTTGGTLAKATLTSGTGITVTNGAGTISLAVNTGAALTWTTTETFSGSLHANGGVLLGAGSSITVTAGSTAADFSNGTGVFKTTTGASTFGGSSNTFTNGITAPSIDTSAAGAFSLGVTNATSVQISSSAAPIHLNADVHISGGQNLIADSGSGFVDFSSMSGSFDSPTGTSRFRGDITVDSGKNVTLQGGTSVFDAGNATGAFNTSQGANHLNGNVIIAANKQLSMASGTANVDFSGSAGDMFSTTGVNNLNGSNNFVSTDFEFLDASDHLIWIKNSQSGASHSLTIRGQLGSTAAGGAVSIYSGGGGAGTLDAGILTLDTGAPTGGANGIANLFTTNATEVNFGHIGCITTVAGTMIGGLVASVFEKNETGSDASVLAYTANVTTDEALVLNVVIDSAAITGTSIIAQIAWTDSEGTSRTKTLITVTAIGGDGVSFPFVLKKNTAATVSTVFTGVSTAYNVTATLDRQI